MENVNECPDHVLSKVNQYLVEELCYEQDRLKTMKLYTHPDPNVPGTFAIRITSKDIDYPIDLLYIGKYSEPIEECEWEVFPPTSDPNNLQFF